MDIKVSFKPSLASLGKSIGDADIAKLLREQINSIALRVERYAKQLTPVDTGRLRASIGTSWTIQGLGAIIQTNTDYAVYVHEGTRYMRGRPFMERGADMAAQNIEGEIGSRIDKEFADRFKSL